MYITENRVGMQFTGNKIQFHQKTFLFISIAWLIVNAVLFWKNGIVIEGEAQKYISQANLLITKGSVRSQNFNFYYVQILLIAFSAKLKFGYWFVVLIQLLFNFIATVSFYKLLRHLLGFQVAFYGILLFIINYPYQEFNTFLQTESLFHSFTLIFSCYLLKLDRLTITRFIIILLSLIIISFTRPSGLLFFPASILYLVFRFSSGNTVTKKIVVLTTSVIVFLFALNTALGSGGSFDFMLPYRQEHIICGVPTVADANIRIADNANSVYGIFYYIIHNPAQFIRLAFERSIAYFGLTRSYYSLTHNILLVMYFYPLYLAAVLSIRYWVKKNAYIFLYATTIIFLTLITAMVTCDDWHNRFFLMISPFLTLLALPVLLKFQRKKPGDEKLFATDQMESERRL